MVQGAWFCSGFWVRGKPRTPNLEPEPRIPNVEPRNPEQNPAPCTMDPEPFVELKP
jgi:hypothetical protein